MVGCIEVGSVELSIVENYKNGVLIVKFAQQTTLLFVVDTIDIGVEPHLSATQGRYSVCFQRYTVYGFFRKQHATGSLRFDKHIREIALEIAHQPCPARLVFQYNLDGFGFSVRVCRKVKHSRTRLALRKVVIPVAGNGNHIETLYVVRTFFAVAINCIVNGTAVVALEHLHVHDALANKHFVGNMDDAILAVAEENDDIVKVRTVLNELCFLQVGAYEAALSVDV